MLEEQVTNISHNMSLLMVALESKLGLLREFGDSNSEIILDGKPRDNEDPKKESWKEHEKEQSSSNNINPS
jgi:hypothetical protein